MADEDWAKLADLQEKRDMHLVNKVKELDLQTKDDATAEQLTKEDDPFTKVGNWADPTDVFNTAPDEEATKADLSYMNHLIRSNLVTTKADLEVLQKDPNSPLFSVRSFEELHLKAELLKGVYGMGFNTPSKIQETALPALLGEQPQNMIAQSQSGTGKTAAFVLTMLSRVDTSESHPQCLCLAPTYELALQIGDVTNQMAKYMHDVKVRLAVRGQRADRNEKLTEHIIIGTPGTMLDWVVKFKLFDIRKIRVFVLDEADVMVDSQGHQSQSIRIQRGLSKTCQLLLFSATYDDEVMKFAQSIVHDAMIIKLKREEESLDNIRQVYIECQNQEDKFSALSDIYGSISIGQSVIFCRTKHTASWLSEQMSGEGHAVALLSGMLDVEQRAAVIKRFREGKEKVLISTNVSARGIDVEQVTVVVNFDVPVDREGRADFETYLHRIGRTGRFGKSGLAINFVDGPKSFSVLKKIEQHFGKPIEKLCVDDIPDLKH